MARVINDAGREIVMRHEGLHLTAYVCPGGKLTIGYGHTGKDVHRGDVITVEEAETLLALDLQHIEGEVERLAPKSNANQFSALVSLAFNIGVPALDRSTLLRDLKAGRPVAASAQFDRWVHSAGAVMPGLVKRRAAERTLFMTLVN